MKPISALWLAGVLSAWGITVGAQTQDPVNPPVSTATTTTSSTTTTSVANTGAPVVVTSSARETPAQTRIIGSFTALAGSEDNARSLVTGLRQGSEITLTTPTSSGSGTASSDGVSFTPPTRPMGYGNIRIALSLAREQLAQSGITQPTPAQLEAALMGGAIVTGTTTGAGGATTTTTNLPGVLQMRADGMGWGQIANSMGVKLGHVMSGRTLPPPAAPATSVSGTAPTGSGTSASTSARSGITSAAGATSSTSSTATTQSRGNSAWAHQTHRPGAGIVTAAGTTAAGTSAGAGARGGGNGAGVVTGAGAAAGSRGAAAVRAQGKGHINP